MIDLSSFDLGDPLLEAAYEIYTVKDYYESLEKQIERVQRTRRLSLDTQLKTQKLTPDDPEWHEAIQEYNHWVDFLLPRFFRGPFLISLFALYESIVSEVTTAIQKQNQELISFKSFKEKKENRHLSFLVASRQYYSEVLKIGLCPTNSTWDQLIILSQFRNAVAHANGRIESLRPALKSKVIQMAIDIPDVDTSSGYLAFGKEFVAGMTNMVLDELLRFIEENREACRPRRTI